MDRLKELAAGFAAGGLDSAEHSELRSLLQVASSQEKTEAAGIVDAAALVGLALPRREPSPALKGKIFAGITPPTETPELFEFVKSTGDSNWLPLKVPGAFVKMLSVQAEKGYAVVLGKLNAQTYYPPHHHICAEQIFVIEGDLHIGDVVLNAGDFHNAKAGSSHGINHSEKGCTILAVISTEDLAALMAQ